MTTVRSNSSERVPAPGSLMGELPVHVPWWVPAVLPNGGNFVPKMDWMAWCSLQERGGGGLAELLVPRLGPGAGAKVLQAEEVC